MIKKSIEGLIKLGEDLRYLRERKEGNHITHEDESIGKYVYVKKSIEEFLEYLKEFNMSVTSRASFDLREFLYKIKEREIGSTLTQTDAEELFEIINSIENTLRAEAEGIHVFIMTEKKFSIKKLTEKIEELFTKKVFDELSEIARYDAKEAGMCIAFERATAAAFHILRATEDILRKLYFSAVKQKRVKYLTWGNILNDLKKRRKKPSQEVIKSLDYICDNFRNPTMHPEERYDIERVQSLFILCIDAISKMVNDPLWGK